MYVCAYARARLRALSTIGGWMCERGSERIGCVGDGGAGGASAMGNDGARELGAVT